MNSEYYQNYEEMPNHLNEVFEQVKNEGSEIYYMYDYTPEMEMTGTEAMGYFKETSK